MYGRWCPFANRTSYPIRLWHQRIRPDVKPEDFLVIFECEYYQRMSESNLRFHTWMSASSRNPCLALLALSSAMVVESFPLISLLACENTSSWMGFTVFWCLTLLSASASHSTTRFHKLFAFRSRGHFIYYMRVFLIGNGGVPEILFIHHFARW